MKHMVNPLVTAITILVATTSLAMAQTTPLPPPAPPASRGLGLQEAQRAASPPVTKQIDGPVKQINPASHTVQVGWFLGLFHTTLEVTDDTQIAVDGMKASLPDIREGDVVKASYEERDGKNLAKMIEVTEAKAQGGASAPARSPGTSSAPSQGSPQGAGGPSTGGPVAP